MLIYHPHSFNTIKQKGLFTMKKVMFLLLIAVATSGNIFGQAQATIYGFVNASAYYDTRQGTGVRENFFFLYPKGKSLDANGNDLNANGQTRIATILSRFGVKLSGAEFYGAKVSGALETEFMGNSEADVNGLRIRHAYANLEWGANSLLVGQYWGMMTPPELIPGVMASNGAAPINPFSRNPQVRFSTSFSNMKFMLGLQTQRDYADGGPNGTSTEYLANAVVPEIHGHLQFKGESYFAGIGGMYKQIRPTLKALTKNYQSDEKAAGYAAMGYVKTTVGSVNLKLEAVYGANLTANTMASGYFVKSTDATTGVSTYSPGKIFSWFADISTGKEIEYGVFVGMASNLGTGEVTTSTWYGRGLDIGSILRVSPRIVWVSGAFKLGVEVEHTSAAYGTPDVANDGKVINTESFANDRASFTVQFNF